MRACMCLNYVVGNGCHNARVSVANVVDAKHNNAATNVHFAATNTLLQLLGRGISRQQNQLYFDKTAPSLVSAGENLVLSQFAERYKADL